jgi:hypothetical protein
MKEEIKNYRNNIQDFISTVINKRLDRISFLLDLNPTFELDDVPFQFKYAHSICFHIEEINYLLSTSQTSLGIETFWIEQIRNLDDIGKSNFTAEINERIEKIEVKEGIEHFYYKIGMETEKNKWWFIAGEIYNTHEGKLNYKFNDEMILAFSNLLEVNKYEEIINENR